VSRKAKSFFTVLAVVVAGGCARRPPALPTGAGAPYPDYAAAYAQATGRCRDVSTFAALLELSGRAGGSRLPRTRIEAGFAAPARIRLEGTAGFGRPLFILVARRAEDATLVLPRDKRVLSEAPAAAIIEALTGVALGADELRGIVSGCGPGLVKPVSARSHEGGWVAIDGGDQMAWLRQIDGTWRVVATERGGIENRYLEFQDGRPSVIRIRAPATSSGGATDLTIRVSDVDINVPLGPEVFQVEIPEDASPLTLEELRRAGPLGSEAR
jgi:hypothetical protein